MFLGYQGEKIKFYTEEPLDLVLYNLDRVEETNKQYVADGDEFVLKNKAWERKQAQRRETEFEKAFFNTSLGYIRRAVTMANGELKDFLSDLLPAISASVQTGQSVNLIAYDKPDFSEEVTEWEQYQHIVQATPQFINECFRQLGNDFLPINTEEE